MSANRFSWVVFYLDPGDWDSRTRAVDEFGYHLFREEPVVVCRLVGSLGGGRSSRSVEFMVEFWSGGRVHYTDLGAFFGEKKDVREVFDAAVVASSELRVALDAGLKLLGGGEVVVGGRLSDVDEWEGGFEETQPKQHQKSPLLVRLLRRGAKGVVGVGQSDKLSDEDEWGEYGFTELGGGLVVLKAEITPKPFDERLGLALCVVCEGGQYVRDVDNFDKWFIYKTDEAGNRVNLAKVFTSWFVYFVNPADAKGNSEISSAFNEVWDKKVSPLVRLCIRGVALDDGLPFDNDLNVKFTLAPNGSVIKMMNDDIFKYSPVDIAAIVDALFAKYPEAKKAVEEGLVLLKQKPVVAKSSKLPDEDEWSGSVKRGGVRFGVNSKILGRGDL